MTFGLYVMQTGLYRVINSNLFSVRVVMLLYGIKSDTSLLYQCFQNVIVNYFELFLSKWPSYFSIVTFSDDVFYPCMFLFRCKRCLSVMCICV